MQERDSRSMILKKRPSESSQKESSGTIHRTRPAAAKHRIVEPGKKCLSVKAVVSTTMSVSSVIRVRIIGITRLVTGAIIGKVSLQFKAWGVLTQGRQALEQPTTFKSRSR